MCQDTHDRFYIGQADDATTAAGKVVDHQVPEQHRHYAQIADTDQLGEGVYCVRIRVLGDEARDDATELTDHLVVLQATTTATQAREAKRIVSERIEQLTGNPAGEVLDAARTAAEALNVQETVDADA